LQVGKHVSIYSKLGTNLNRYSPEVVAGVARLKPRKLELDGELLIIAFDSLQSRMHPSRTASQSYRRRIPTHTMSFDVLADANGKDLRG